MPNQKIKQKLQKLSKKFKKLNPEQRWSVVTGAFTIVLFAILAFSAVLLQRNLREGGFDTRKEAAVTGGRVVIATDPQSGAILNIDQNARQTITFRINTFEEAIYGVQLQFNLIHSAIQDADPEINIIHPSLQEVYRNVEDINNGHRISIMLAPAPGTSFTTYDAMGSRLEDMFEVSFTPAELGGAIMVLNNINSIAVSSIDGEDVLRAHTYPYSYTITDDTVDTERCAVYYNGANLVQQCATCGDSICSDYEQCTSFYENNPNTYDPDCGPLFCPDDCTTTACSETDAGQDYENQGTIVAENIHPEAEDYCTQNPDGSWSCEDFCFEDFGTYGPTGIGSGDNLNEWFCNTLTNGETRISFDRRPCDNGCSDGACLPGTATPTATPTETSCADVENFQVTSIGCNETGNMHLSLDWDDIPNATQYQLSLHELTGNQVTMVEYPTDSEMEFPRLPSGEWFITVRADEGCSPTPIYNTLLISHECPGENIDCEYDFGDWSACTNGYETRSYTVTQGTDCPAPADSLLQRQCSTQCEYSYGEWSECINGWQSRNIDVVPDPCYFYEDRVMQETIRYCGTDNPSLLDMMIYSYEACWYYDSAGQSVYFIWDETTFNNATWIDVSPYSDFREFANKNIENTAQSFYDNYLVTDGTGFHWNHNGAEFNFAPATTYYVRLYNGSHSQVASMYMPRCAGTGGVAPQLCNQSCDSHDDCAVNLACYNGQCRLATNLDSEICANPPDAGLNRTCNEYCADTRECADGYSCWWNRCRNPRNLDDTQCAEPITRTVYYQYYTPATYTEESGCNDYCANNRDCPADYRCYYNQCRLASDPDDITCGGAVSSKGGVTEEGEDQIAESTEEQPTPTKIHQPLDTGIEDDSKPIEEQTALDALKEYLESRGLSLIWLAIIGAGALFLIIILLVFLSKKDDDDQPPMISQNLEKNKFQSNKPMTDQSKQMTPPPSSMMDKIKKKGVQPPQK